MCVCGKLDVSVNFCERNVEFNLCVQMQAEKETAGV